ncbi:MULTISPECIES: competence protein CoiA [Bacillus]|uniref:Competence protein CoiA family protein n=1 Tax=Bacillus glycinifermentans TaxID=1664069 RepID=A0A0T6BIA8_9BACI|nr:MULTISPECIES: competence protein CoiA family protein [Bacillus]KRT87094.1 hypothetical protein AB447_209000 [Bacillus glycinifermentans]MEC0342580.1 competence protein CoiA family protein [Bacillus sonorensis]MEC0457459.1 competence protein CoiA family protein [Bacillus sonorensis]MEC0487142.1 competence protein CoiA family protein [Bacillus glycinifermentans]MEC0530746.1 competence protein CoiA family protein [Bacillus sonorensis]
MNESKEIVYAWEELSRGDLYYCPHCYSEMIYRKGEINRPHFAHKALVDCPFSGDNESKEHYDMKKIFFNFLKNKYPSLTIELEKCLIPNRRADMVIYGQSQTLVVEFQASKIEFKDVKERTQDYNKLGYPVLWIFHINRFGYEQFHNEKKRKQIPYELVEMLRLDSLFVMDSKGFIQKCSGKKTPKTKKVCEYRFFPVKMDFKFNRVIRRDNNKSLFLCQLGKDSIYSKKNLYYGYGYLKTGSKNLFSKLKELLPSAFFKIEKLKRFNNYVAFLLFMEDERIQIKSAELFLSKKNVETESIIDHFKRSNQPQISKVSVQKPKMDQKSDKKEDVPRVSNIVQAKSPERHANIQDFKSNDYSNNPLKEKINKNKRWLTIILKSIKQLFKFK